MRPSSVHKEDILKNVGNLTALGSIDFHSIMVNTKNNMEDPIGYQHSSKYLPLYSIEERNTKGFAMT